MSACWALLPALAISAVAGVARGEPADVKLENVGCEDLDMQQVERILSVELRENTRRPGQTAITLSCSAGQAQLTVQDGTTGKTVTTTANLASSAAIARPRVVALAIAELVQWSWAEPSPAVPRPARHTSPPKHELPVDHSEKVVAQPNEWSFQALLSNRWQRPVSAPFWGGGARASVRRLHLGASADITFDRARAELTGAAARASVLSLGGSVWLSSGRSLVSIGAGLGGRVGYAHLSGEPARSDLVASEVTGVWGGPCGVVGLGFDWGSLSLRATAELGWALARVDGRVADLDRFEIGGPWLGLQLAAGARL